MKFLVTGDVHLSEDHPERFEAFAWIISQGDRRDVDGVLISGDLFDNNSAFRRLRGEFVDLVEEVSIGMPLITVPGNHDNDLTSGTYLGEGVRVLDRDERSYAFQKDGRKVTVYGLPYLRGESSTAYFRELDGKDVKEPSILLAHGSLVYPDREYIYSGISRQGGERDFLIYPEGLPDRGLNAVVLGHWHRFDHFVEGGRHYLYTGSPLPAAKDDFSRKFYEVIHLSPEGEVRLDKYPVRSPGSWYYRRERIFVLPDEEDNGTGRLRERLESLDGDRRRWLIITVEGFLGTEDERKVRRSMEDVIGGYRDEYYEVELDWDLAGVETLDRPIVSKFMDEVTGLEDSEIRELSELFLGDRLPCDHGDLGLELTPDKIRRRALKKSLRVMADRLEE